MRTFRQSTTRLTALGAAALLGLGGLGISALATATPASAAPVNQYFAFHGPTGFSAVAVSSDWAASAATVHSGSNFTFTSQPNTTVVPQTASGVTVLSISNNVQYYPIPPGTTYVSAVASGPVSFTPLGGGAATTTPLVITYCPTASSPGCTAHAPYTNFLGDTPAPYLQIGTGSAVFPAGGSLTTPGVTVTLTGQAGGTTANWTQTEFDTSTSVDLGTGTPLAVKVVGYPYAGPVPANASATALPLLSPPPTLASVDVAGSATVSAVLPNSGPVTGGTQVKVIGTFLQNPTAVTFGSTPASDVIPLTADSLLATAPPGAAGTVNVIVTTATSGSPSSPADQFTYTNGPIVTGVSPNAGPPSGGTTVVITGQQLAGATAVHFGSATATITANSGTSITAVAPAGTGIVDVTVTAGGQTSTTSQQDRFSYNTGYWLAANDGDVFSFGNAPFYGSAGGTPLNAPVVGISTTPDGAGYWLVASDGGVFAYGDARFFGSTGGHTLNSPMVGIAATPDGFGYWLVAADGGVFSYGDAQFFGSTGSIHLNKPVVGISASPGGNGYWMAASDGGIFAFGNAPFKGSLVGTAIRTGVIGIASSSTGQGYWMATADGGVFNEGDAAPFGSKSGLLLNKPMAGIAASSASGYWLVGRDGGIFNYGVPFYGSAATFQLNIPIVGMAAVG